MKLFTKNTFRNLALSALSAAVLSACGGAGSCATCTTPTPGSLTLSIAAPSQYPAGLATPIEASLTMTNTSSVDANNLVYNIPSPNQTGNYTGVVITPNAGIGSQSGACTNIAAGASCTFSATIAAYANPGSFTVTATPNGSKSSATKATQVGKSLQAGDSISVTANLGLVDVPNTSNEYYVLPSDQTVQGSTGSPSTVYVSVWVKQAGAGLNSLKLVDELGTDLTYVAVGTPSYAVNSVNSYKVTIPAGKTIQHIQAFGYNGSTPVCTTLNNGENNNTACSNDADVNLAQSGVGILAIQPNYFQMSSSHESQVVTLQNVGTANITAMQMPVIAAPFSVLANTCTGITSLKPADSCSVTIGYTAGIDSGQVSYVVNYNNGTSAVNTTATIPYVGTNPTTYAILTTSPTSFSLSESHPLQRITVTNTGTAVATGITLPTLTVPLTESATTCTNTLAINASCSYDVYIDYSQAVIAGRESVTFSYNNGQQQNQTTNVAADWGGYTPVAPQLVNNQPIESSINVSSAPSISITFDLAMNPATLIASNFVLQTSDGVTTIRLAAPIVSSDGKSVNFATDSALASNTSYKLIIPTPANITSARGVALDLPIGTYPAGVISNFTTATYTSGFCNGSGGFAWFLNQGANSVTKCAVTTIGTLSSCSGGDTPVNGLSSPSAGIQSFNGVKPFYIANSTNNTVGNYYTNYANSSSYTGLPATSPDYVTNPTGIASYNGNPIYVVNSNSTLSKCVPGYSPYNISSCAVITTPTGYPSDAYGIGIYSGPYPYVVIYFTANKLSNTISACPDVGNSGSITACTPAGGSNFNQPVSITSSLSKSYILVANAGDSTVTRCDVSTSSGTALLSNCTHTGSNFNNPSAILEYFGYAYITNKGDNTVTLCKDTAGELSECSRMHYGFSTPSGAMAYNPCN